MVIDFITSISWMVYHLSFFFFYIVDLLGNRTNNVVKVFDFMIMGSMYFDWGLADIVEFAIKMLISIFYFLKTIYETKCKRAKK